MKGLKVIAVISFVLTLYPILAIPVKFKEWLFAILAFFIFLISLALLYIFSEDKLEKSYSENTPKPKETERPEDLKVNSDENAQD